MFNFKNLNNKKITIQTQLAVPLGELATYILKPNQNSLEIVNILESDPKPIETNLIEIIGDVISVQTNKVQIISLKFDYMDTRDLSTGTAYFNVILNGKENALRKVTSDDGFFLYDWDDREN